MCVRFVADVIDAPPSPKLQERLLIVPVEMSLKVTVNGVVPLVGVAVNSATGAMALLPVTRLVELPPLAVVKMTLFVNPPAVTGAKLTVTLVEPPGATLKAGPPTMVYGPPATVAMPLVTREGDGCSA